MLGGSIKFSVLSTLLSFKGRDHRIYWAVVEAVNAGNACQLF